MYLYRVDFELDRKGKVTTNTEWIAAETFADVYEKVKPEIQENYELVQIKKEVPILSIIQPKE